MEIIELNDHVVKMWDTIDEMPIDRYNTFHMYLLQESGIGSKLEDIDKRFARLDTFLKNDRVKDAIKERANMHTLFFGLINRINYNQRAFAVMVHSIDAEEFKDMSESGIDIVLEKLAALGLSQKVVEESNDQKKKKLKLELKMYFPHRYGSDIIESNYILSLKRIIKLQAEFVATGDEELLKKVENEERNIAGMQAPQILYNDQHNHVVRNKVEFAKMKAILEERGYNDPTHMTVLNFNGLMDHIEEKNRKDQGRGKRRTNGRAA